MRQKKCGRKFSGGPFVLFNIFVMYSSLCQLQKLLRKKKKNNPLRQAIFSTHDKQNNYSQTKLKATDKKIEA